MEIKTYHSHEWCKPSKVGLDNPIILLRLVNPSSKDIKAKVVLLCFSFLNDLTDRPQLCQKKEKKERMYGWFYFLLIH